MKKRFLLSLWVSSIAIAGCIFSFTNIIFRTSFWVSIAVALTGAIVFIVWQIVVFKQYVLEPIRLLEHRLKTSFKDAAGLPLALERIPSDYRGIATAINEIADILKVSAFDLARQERQAVLGRIAAGLIHDLRHPIQSLQNCGKNLDQAVHDDVMRATLKRNFDRELSKINQFLRDLQHLTQELPHVPISLSVKNLLEESLASFQDLALEHHVEVVMNCTPESLALVGDYFSLNRLLSNLISNALDAMESGGVLTATAGVDPSDAGKIVIEIRDTGTGIPADRLTGIFEEFWTSKPRGIGLGLAIARRIAELHGGRLEVKSVLSQGTRFTVVLPCSIDAIQ